jgi:hypothetical protein
MLNKVLPKQSAPEAEIATLKRSLNNENRITQLSAKCVFIETAD